MANKNNGRINNPAGIAPELGCEVTPIRTTRTKAEITQSTVVAIVSDFFVVCIRPFYT